MPRTDQPAGHRTAEDADPRSAGAPHGRGLAVAVLAAAVAQAAAPLVTILGPGSSPGAGSGAELLITPAGWAFSIWSLIYLLAIAQAALALVRAEVAAPRRLQSAQLVLYLGATVWIGVAGLDSSVLTALTLAVMLAAGLTALLTDARTGAATRARLLTRVTVGLYAGWVTAAFFLNVATAAVALDLADADAVGWQLGVLVVATATLLAVLVRARGSLPYAVAGVWALVGITATGLAGGTTAVAATAVCAAVLVAGCAGTVATLDRRRLEPRDA